MAAVSGTPPGLPQDLIDIAMANGISFNWESGRTYGTTAEGIQWSENPDLNSPDGQMGAVTAINSAQWD